MGHSSISRVKVRNIPKAPMNACQLALPGYHMPSSNSTRKLYEFGPVQHNMLYGAVTNIIIQVQRSQDVYHYRMRRSAPCDMKRKECAGICFKFALRQMISWLAHCVEQL